MKRWNLWGALALACPLFACGASDEMPEHVVDTSEPVTVRVQGVELEPGEERTDDCVSFTLNNDEPLYVSAAELDAGFGWHHTIWFYMAEDEYPGADGVVTTCEERGFDVLDGALKAGVVFASSPQVTAETQTLPAGAVVEIPPRSKLIGQLHLFNASGTAFTTDLDLTLVQTPEDQVETFLSPLVLAYLDLNLAPNRRTEVTTNCDFGEHLDGAMDFRIHYVLPHYHSYADRFSLTSVAGKEDNVGEVIYDIDEGLGEPLGTTFDPPHDPQNATGLRLSCGFNNTTDNAVYWGDGEQEMCIAFAFTDSNYRWIGGGLDGVETGTDADGTVQHQADCTLLALPPI